MKKDIKKLILICIYSQLGAAVRCQLHFLDPVSKRVRLTLAHPRPDVSKMRTAH